MDQEKIWEEYQNNPELQQMGCRDGGRVEIVANNIRSGSSVLNIGVGLGNLENLLSNRNVDMYSLDPSESSIASLRSSLGMGDKAQVGYCQNIPFSEGTFDYVVMSEVLEHLSDDVLEVTRTEVARVLKSNGTFLGTVPADENLKQGLVVCPDCSKIFHRWGHLQSFSKERLEIYLSREFKNIKVSRRSFNDWKSLNWKGKTEGAIKNIQAKLGVRGSGQNFLFRCTK